MSSNFKKKLSAFAAMLALVSVSSAAMAVTDADVIRNDNGSKAMTSNAQIINTNATRTDINVTSRTAGDIAQIDFKNFNVGKGEHVNYGFSAASQTMINRVLGGNKSVINGKITSSCLTGNACGNVARDAGKVVFINPAGVMFGQGSTVDLNSFTVSTFDFNGAKNLKNMSDAELKNYQNNTLNKMSPVQELNGIANAEDAKYGSINFDSNYTKAFEEADIDVDKLRGNTSIELNGTHFDRFNDDGTVADFNTNKTVNIVSDNVVYKDSLIRVGDNLNATGDKSDGNVRIITADGVTFTYAANGYSSARVVKNSEGKNVIENDYKIANDTKDVQRTISIENSGKDGAYTGIEAGNVTIMNQSNAAGSTIKVKDATIKANKMVNGENGIVCIKGTDDVEIANTRIDTLNTEAVKEDGTKLNTLNKDNNGKVIINADKNLKVTNSAIKTEGSNIDSNDDAFVSMVAKKGNLDVKNTRVVADGNIAAQAGGKTNIDNSLLEAKNSVNNSIKKEVMITGGETGIDINDSVASATGNVNIYSRYSSGNVAGDIKITSTPKNGENQTLITAGDNVSIEGKNTTLDNASFKYKNIKFHDNNTKGLNNVTVANDSTFTQIGSDGKNTGNVVLETNGNFTMDKATMRTAEAKYTVAPDNGKSNAFDFTVNVTPATAKNVDITSTEGNVTVKRASDIKATNDINMTATKGNYTQVGSDLKAGNDVNITADKDVEVTSGIDRHPDMEGGIFIYEGISAGKDVNITSKNGGYNQDSADINAKNDVNITAKNDVNARYSYIDADKDININAGKNVNMGNINDEDTSYVIATAGNDANITAGEQINVYSSYVNAKTGNATLTANGEGDNGNINLTNGSKVEAGNDVTVKSTKGNEVNVDNSKVIAGSDNDNEGFDKVKDPNDTIGDATIEATSGSVNIKNNSTVTSQDKDVNIIAKNDISFANKEGKPVNIDKSSNIEGANNVKIQSTNGDIVGEKTQMPEIKYGNRLEFNAKGNNIFTSDDSLKAKNVDFVAGEGNKFYTQGDIQFVNSSLESPNNFVESGKDVIMNNLNIKQATPNPEDTKTQIFANGNVTTDNVTNEDLTAKGGTYPQSVSTDRTGTGKTVLDVNQTKVTIQTDTVKDPANPDYGSITIDVKNANNPKAGLELTAQNVDKLDQDPTDGDFRTGYYKSGDPKWDENIEPKEGPEVHLNAVDDEVAIKNIDTDKLTLDSGDTFIADTTDGTPVIVVKDKGGLNLDPHENYDDGDPDGFTYTENYDTKDKTVTGGDLTFDPWSEWELIKTYTDDDGVTHNIYQSTRNGEITDRITKETDQRHTITFDNNGNPQDFTLVYDKTKETVEPGHTITAQDVMDDPSKLPGGTTPEDFVKQEDRPTDPVPPCPPEPPVDPVYDNYDSYIDQVTLPREQVEVSKTSTVADGTADQTSSIMSAAAKVDIAEGDTESDSDNDDEDEELE